MCVCVCVCVYIYNYMFPNALYFNQKFHYSRF